MYDVKFTTRRQVTVYGPNREIVSDTITDVPVALSNLPRITAERYAVCDNFVMTPHVVEFERGGKQQRKTAIDQAMTIRQERGHKPNPRVVAHKTALEKAAETGDMGAALNARS